MKQRVCSKRFAACGLVLALAGCATVQRDGERLLQGKWTYGEQLGENFAAGLTWSIEGDRYRITGYPPMDRSGRLRVTARDGNRLTVHLYERWDARERISEPEADWVVELAPDGKQLTLNGSQHYRRSESKD